MGWLFLQLTTKHFSLYFKHTLKKLPEAVDKKVGSWSYFTNKEPVVSPELSNV